METQELNNFEVTFAIEKDLSINDFLFGKQIEKSLNDNLTLSDYTTKYDTLFIIFQCFALGNKYMQVKENCKFRHKKRVIELYTIVDYKLFKEAEEESKNKLLKNSLETGLDNFIKLKNKSFNKLTEDIKTFLK